MLFNEHCILACLQHDYAQMMPVMIECICIQVVFSAPLFI